jgi:hypothetical protein
MRQRTRRIAVAAALAALTTAALGTTTDLATSPAAALAAPTVVPTVVSGKVDRSSRAAVLAAYRDRYLAPLKVLNNWTGSTSSCSAGGTSTAYRDATLTAIDWARGQAGIAPVPGLNSTYSYRAQQAALVMQANGALSHNPPSSWRCWTSTAAAGASHGNIALGAAGPRTVGMYLSEPGASNINAGHRRWLLYPRLGAIGIGNTSKANTVYVLGTPLSSRPSGTPAYYGWPTSGYFPRAAEPAGLWSLSSSLGYSFRYAKVTVRGPGGTAVAVTRYTPVTGYGDNTLTWRLATRPDLTVRSDQTWRVTVTGIRTPSGATTSYVYYVTLVS